MRPSSIFAASLFALARARIDGIGVPSTIKPGEPFDLIFLNEIYIQRVTDVAMAVGYYAGADSNHLGSSLGTFVTAFDLVADSNAAANYNKTVTLPLAANAPDNGTTAAVFTASLTSLYGVLSMPVLSSFNVSITIGDETSSDYVYSVDNN